MTPTIITEELVTSFQEKLVTAQKLKREFLVLRRQLDSPWFVGGKHGFDPFNFPLLDRISKHANCNDLDQILCHYPYINPPNRNGISAIGLKAVPRLSGPHDAFGPCVDGSRLSRVFRMSQLWSGQPCVRPSDAAHMAAGHNAFRGSGPGQKPAFDNALAQLGCPDHRTDRFCITCCLPFPTVHSRHCWRYLFLSILSRKCDGFLIAL